MKITLGVVSTTTIQCGGGVEVVKLPRIFMIPPFSLPPLENFPKLIVERPSPTDCYFGTDCRSFVSLTLSYFPLLVHGHFV